MSPLAIVAERDSTARAFAEEVVSRAEALFAVRQRDLAVEIVNALGESIKKG